ncbi:Hypothetical predicted protein [Marmota monax]|uniref:Uncharacterized protein n=1 Tax=Marmota monax TaxID=9995 RepID=A0A5E4BSK0_MARMO|nr:Hypothetical predicted protein [Marmota monax]
MIVAMPHLCCLLAWPLPQAQLLKELEHRVTQEALTRQQLDVIKTSSMEKLLEEVGHKEQQLQLLTEEAERASKLGQLQRRKMERDLRQAQLLKELEHRVTQEALTRQQLDVIKTSSMEKLLEEVGHKEQQLQLLTEEAERASKLGQLQRRKMERDLRQTRSRLAQERSVKLDAFQRIEELQSQLPDTEQLSIQRSSPGGLISQAHCSLSSASTLSRYSHQHFLKTNLMGNKITRRIQRPKTVPIKHKKRTDKVFLPNVTGDVQLTAFQVQTAPSRIPFGSDW